MEKGHKNLDVLPIHQETRNFIIDNKLHVRKNHMGARKGEHKKSNFLRAYDGYDAFQNLIIVRNYIQRKYDITINTLELLLYLFPKNFFTHSDYNEIPKQFIVKGVVRLQNKGLIKVAVRGKDGGIHRNLYTLSTKGKNIVFTFYELMSGAKPIPLAQSTNPMAKADATTYDKKLMKLIIKTQGLTNENK